MAQVDLTTFYATAAGSGATLIGFLAVANSIIESRGNSKSSALQEGILAESAYIAFANVFLVGLMGLEPFINTGYGAAVFALIGLYSTWRVARSGLYKLKRLSRTRARASQTVLFIGLGTYAAELIAGWLTVLHDDSHAVTLTLVYVVILLMGVGLVRAWELLGVKDILGGRGTRS